MDEEQMVIESSKSPQRTSRSFFHAWLRYPQQVASVCPSSRFMAQSLADQDCIRTARRMVELGPGTGKTTRELLRQLPSDGHLLTIEKVADFIAPLLQIDDERLQVHHGDASELSEILSHYQFNEPDVIVSGIPFSHLDPSVGSQIIKEIYEALPIGGRFIAYQFRDDVTELARPYLGDGQSSLVLLNVPPLRIYHWTKQ